MLEFDVRRIFVCHGSPQMDTDDLIKENRNAESRKGISEIEGKAVRVAASEAGAERVSIPGTSQKL